MIEVVEVEFNVVLRVVSWEPSVLKALSSGSKYILDERRPRTFI